MYFCVTFCHIFFSLMMRKLLYKPTLAEGLCWRTVPQSHRWATSLLATGWGDRRFASDRALQGIQDYSPIRDCRKSLVEGLHTRAPIRYTSLADGEARLWSAWHSKQEWGIGKVTVVVANLLSSLLSAFLEVLIERIATLLVSMHWRGCAFSILVVCLLLTCCVTLVLVQVTVVSHCSYKTQSRDLLTYSIG